MSNNEADNEANKKFWKMVEGDQFLRNFFAPYKRELMTRTKEQQQNLLNAIMRLGAAKVN